MSARKYPQEGEKECVVCRRIWHYIRKGSNIPPKTCSIKCRYQNLADQFKKEKLKHVCANCGKEFEIYYAWAKRGEGIWCSRKCQNSLKIRYPHKEKVAAQNAVRKAVKKGEIIKTSCLVCGNPRVENHHYRGYAKEDWLKVQWYCDLHHHQEHNRLRKTKESLLL